MQPTPAQEGQTARQAADVAANARQLAEDAMQAAQRELQGAAREGTGGVIVRNNPEGVVIAIPGEDGEMRRIVLSHDNREIVALEGISATPVMPRTKRLPEGMVEIFGIMSGIVAVTTIFGPIMKALGRRIERRSAEVPSEVSQRLVAIEQAVETVAVEVERISEGQRFTARLLAERGGAQAARVPVETEAR